MKICFLAGADSIHSKRWIEYFTKKRNEVHWISLTKNCFEEIKDIKFYLLKQFSSKLLDIIFNIVSFRKLIRKIKPDILHAHYAGVNGVIAALSGFHPFVLTAWGSDILIATKSKAVKLLVKFALKRADLITCDAVHMKEAMIKLGVPNSKIKIIYFGVDTQKFSPGPKNEELIKKLNIENDPIIISLRSFDPIYNVETLIRAIPLVLKEFPTAKFIIGGKGPEEQKLKKMAKSLEISDSIRFIGWILNNELPKYLKTADIYISTSLSDAGISSCTAEAMAVGLPVVITNTGENEKWVEDNKSGFLIPVKNSEILAEKIICLLEDENKKDNFKKAGIEMIEKNNSYYGEMEKMEKIYEELVRK